MSFTAYTVPTHTAFTAKLIIGTGLALFPTFGAYHSAIGASVTAIANHFNAVFTDSAFCTVIALTAYTIPTHTTFTAKLVICTRLTLFRASGTNYSAIRASITAIADLFNTVFTDSALRTIIALATYTVPTHTAFTAKLILSTHLTFFSA